MASVKINPEKLSKQSNNEVLVCCLNHTVKKPELGINVECNPEVEKLLLYLMTDYASKKYASINFTWVLSKNFIYDWTSPNKFTDAVNDVIGKLNPKIIILKGETIDKSNQDFFSFIENEKKTLIVPDLKNEKEMFAWAEKNFILV
jgi:hypothetical protein